MMQVGKYTYGNSNIEVKKYGPLGHGKHSWSNSEIIIGKYCSIGSGIKMYLNENHRYDWVTTYPFGHLSTQIFNNFKTDLHDGRMSKGNGNITIGNDVWIADNVTIMSGVNIGDGAVIATNTHVVKDILPYSITGGNPGKHIKFRFNELQIEKLLQIKWWDFDEEIINNNLSYFVNDDIDKFIDKFI